jgi:hypothetical protein
MGLRLSSNDGNTERRLARISSSARSLQFQITESDKNGRPHERLRYRLEGYDDSWRDLPVRMRASIRFNDINQQLVSSSTFYIDGESPGWRGTVETSDFVTRREEATAPERYVFSTKVRPQFPLGEYVIGLTGKDAGSPKWVPIAWRLSVVDVQGKVLASTHSFLWGSPTDLGQK